MSENNKCGCHSHSKDNCCAHSHEHNEHKIGCDCHNHIEGREEFKLIILRIIAGVLIFIQGFRMMNENPEASVIFYLISYLCFGYDVVFNAFKNLLKGRILDENFLMTIASIGAFIIKEYPEAIAVMAFYQVGEMVQDMAVDKSVKSIKELMDLSVQSVRVIKAGVAEEISPEKVLPGDRFEARPGEKIALDGVVSEGEAYLDMSALTGESVPVKVRKGDKVLSGSICLESVLVVESEKLYKDSTVMKIMALMDNATDNKSKTENFVTAFAKVYTPVVVILAILIATVPFAFGVRDLSWVHRALVFLVASCPCALVLSIPLTFFCGIGACSAKGVLVKGSNHIQSMAQLKAFVFDKTGTLTEGKFKVINPDEALLGLAASVEKFSNHPIAAAIVEGYEGDLQEVVGIREEAGLGISGEIQGERIYIGNKRLMEKLGIEIKENENEFTTVYVAKENEYLGEILLGDEIKESSRQGLEQIRKMGIDKLYLLSGDKERTALIVGKELGINKVYSELMPQDKISELERLLADEENTAFVGDGINDAPAIARARVGFAMGMIGSDAAIEGADVVVMRDSISDIAGGISIARKTMRIVKENIVFILLVKLIVLLFAFLGLANMWCAVVADVGVALICVLNANKVRFKND